MNKLTADKCREQIDDCIALKERGYLSINGEYKLQALEIALPILEQQERGEGWIEWGGGDCPVNKNKVVYVKFRDGEIDDDGTKAGWMRWSHIGKDWDIIAYRIIPEQPTNQNGEQ